MIEAEQIDDLRDRGALFVVLSSGGKDSQAMFIEVARRVPRAQIVVVHAVLDEVEWEGSEQHIRDTIDGVPLVLAQPASTFFEMVDRQRRFPSPSNRQCTSDLKRTPNEREIRRYLKLHPEFGGLAVVCMGMRAQESSTRAKLATFKRSARGSKAGREWYEWLPIHGLSAAEVFASIAAAGQKPFWTYAAGMRRKSCCFCIMACDSDLRRAAELRPALYRRYVEKERELNFTLSMSRRTLPQITGIE